jgi:hypothetical protein
MIRLTLPALFGVLAIAQPAAAVTVNAKPSGPPPPGAPCADNGSGAKACFQRKGDKFYVRDDAGDGHSAVAVWSHYLGDGQYKKGNCRNALGKGRWGVCNYNMTENSYIEWWAAEYDAGTKDWYEWSHDQSDIS